MPTVEPNAEQREQQRQAPPQKDARVVETSGKPRDPNAANLSDVASLEREQKRHLGGSSNAEQQQQQRKASAPSKRCSFDAQATRTMPNEAPKPKQQSAPAPTPAPAPAPRATQWTPVQPPTTGPATRGYGFVDPTIKNPTSAANSTGIERQDD